MKQADILKRIKCINQTSLSLYLNFLGFSCINIAFDNEYTDLFKQAVPKKFIGADNALYITEKSEAQSISYVQFLYDIEVFDSTYSEIHNVITFDRFCEFYKNMYRKISQDKWKMVFVSKNYFSDAMEKQGVDIEYLDCNKCESKTILVLNTSADIEDYIKKYKKSKYIVKHYALELIREWLISEICDYFKALLSKRGVTLVLSNWQWARNNILYPDSDITMEKIEKRSQYSIYNIAGVENEYMDFLNQLYEDTSKDYLTNIFDIPSKISLAKGKIRHSDIKSKYINVLSGERLTPGNPSKYDNTIYMLGGCVFFGYAIDDENTISAKLQEKLNECCKNKRWRVRNFATWGGNIDQTYATLFDLEYKSGDMVFISYAGLLPVGEFDISDSMADAYQGHEFYYDGIFHCNADGYEQVANNIYAAYRERFEEITDSGQCFRLENIDKSDYMDENIEKYIRSVKESINFESDETKKIGAIVMNCNPFTMGHKYLIESASKQVDLLLIFVVEENKSFFDFEDRIRLVREGTASIENVRVVPSGSFIISTVTFPGYFMKDNPENAVLDSSQDVELFAKKIAPAFNIKIRFVGEEPFDVVTRQYNETMKRILPQYGIELLEIKRKKTGEKVISATTVRKLLKEQNFEEISKYVPQVTLRYLKQNYADK